MIEGLGLFARLMNRVADPKLRLQYKTQIWRFLKVHRRPGLFMFYVFHMAMHYHVWKLSKDMASREAQVLNVY